MSGQPLTADGTSAAGRCSCCGQSLGDVLGGTADSEAEARISALADEIEARLEARWGNLPHGV